MTNSEELGQIYSPIIEQAIKMLISPAFDIYSKSIDKCGLSEYPSDPKAEYLLQHEIFVAILLERKKLCVPVLMSAVRGRYQRTLDYLDRGLKDRFREGGDSIFGASPFWGGIAELCLHIFSIEQNQPYTLREPTDELVSMLNLIAAIQLGQDSQRYDLPKRLLLGVDDRYFQYVNEVFSGILNASQSG